MYNDQKTYIDDYDPWLGILVAAEFVILSTSNILKVYTLIPLVFDHDMIFHIEHIEDWEILHQKNQEKINKFNTCKKKEKS